MSVNIPSYLQPFTSDFYGLQTITAEEIKQANLLYQNFLDTMQLTAAAVASASPAQQLIYKAKYAEFLEKKLGDIYQVESLVALSPDEQKKRNILFETFSTVLKMLDALQGTVRSISRAMTFFAKYQDQYTSMMTKIPTYVIGASNTITPNTTDFGKTKLGYANVTIEDALKSLLFTSDPSDPNHTPPIDRIYDGISNNTSFLDTRTISTGNYSVSITYSPSSILASVTIKVGSTVYTIQASPIAPPPLESDARNIIGSITADLTQDFTAQVAVTPAIATQVPGLAWADITVASGNADIDKARLQTRAEINGQLQLAIENARSLRQQIKDRMQPIQDLLSQSREAISAQSSLLSSVTDSMKGIVASIFR